MESRVLIRFSCLVIQVAGASSAAGNNHPDQEVLNGKSVRIKQGYLANDLLAIHIYMGGVALQQFFILIFLFFAVQFHRHILQQMRNGVEDRSRALQLLYAIYAVLVLITVCELDPCIAQALTGPHRSESFFVWSNMRVDSRVTFPGMKHSSTAWTPSRC